MKGTNWRAGAPRDESYQRSGAYDGHHQRPRQSTKKKQKKSRFGGRAQKCTDRKAIEELGHMRGIDRENNTYSCLKDNECGHHQKSQSTIKIKQKKTDIQKTKKKLNYKKNLQRWDAILRVRSIVD